MSGLNASARFISDFWITFINRSVEKALLGFRISPMKYFIPTLNLLRKWDPDLLLTRRDTLYSHSLTDQFIFWIMVNPVRIYQTLILIV